MKIKSIQLQNFLSYYETNEFEFGDGPTIIIGQNNTGKSKIFDAFNWVLFDKAYDNDSEEWKNTKNWGIEIVNRRARSESKVNTNIAMSVSLDITSSDNTKYSIIRDFLIRKIDHNKWDFPSSSELYLSLTDGKTRNTTSLDGNDAKEKVNEIFPKQLSKYFFFQGESINEVMSLNKRSAFDKALNGLSKIEVFKNLSRYAKAVEKRTTEELKSKKSSNDEKENRKVHLINEIKTSKENINDIERGISDLQDELKIAVEVHGKKEDELSSYGNVNEHLTKLKEAEEKIPSLNDKRNQLLEAQTEKVLESWMFASTDNMLINFSKLFKDAREKGKYPEPVTVEYLKEMLEKETCLICTRDAKKGSKHYNIIKNIIDERTGDADEMLDIMNIKTHVDSFLGHRGVKKDIKDFYEKLEDIDLRIEEAHRSCKSLGDELDSIIPVGMTREEIEKKDFDGMLGAYQETKVDVENFRNKISTEKGRLSSKKEFLDKMQNELQKLIDSEDVNLESLRYNYSKDFSYMCDSIVESFMSNLLNRIEKSANEHFKKMTSKNKSHSGSVVIDYDGKEVFLQNQDGSRRTNINQGDKVSLQISFVAAILSVSNEYWQDDFPFIADAPVSALGGDNKLPAVDAMTDIFKQSIIILKDDVRSDDGKMKKIDPIRELIKDKSNIKYAYELFIEGEDETNQVTKFVSLKG